MRPGAVRLVVLAVIATGAAGAVGATGARAAPWCGTTTTVDRAPALTGRPVRVVYALPSDGTDRSAEQAAQLSADVDEIATWWRGQDPTREPRFDRVAFVCGLQADVLVVRLAQGTATLRDDATRFDLIADAVEAVTGPSRYDKHLVYFDGAVTDEDLCGEGAGSPDGPGIAIVYLAACSGVPRSAVAAHELVHALGAVPDPRPPHACAESRAHVCDGAMDLLTVTTAGTPLGGLALDVGRDDYYGHAGTWLDVQDSGWLRLVTQVQLTLGLAGRGSVESDLPGLRCTSACVTEWDAGAVVSLAPRPASGQRFVRWSGACTGSGSCSVTLSAAQSVSAVFAPTRFGLVLSITGKGSVTGAGAACRVARCARSATSHAPLRLRATAARGWRFAGWSGTCTGRAATCTVPMTKATAVRARFVPRG